MRRCRLTTSATDTLTEHTGHTMTSTNARRPLWATTLAGITLGMSLSSAGAQSVAMSGGMGSKALLVVNGGAPKALAAGEVHRGVKVVSVSSEQTVVEIEGKRLTIPCPKRLREYQFK